MMREEKIKFIKDAKSFVGAFPNLAKSQEIRGRMPQVGAAVCRALAYRLRYQGPSSLTPSVYETASGTALIDQRIFDVAQRAGENPMQLLRAISSRAQQMVSTALKQSPEHALYLLEYCVIMFELGQLEE